MADTAREITIAAPLVHFLRDGVKRELSSAVSVMQVEVDTVFDPAIWQKALARFDAARTLFDTIGWVDDPEQQDVVLDPDRWSDLLLRALEGEYIIETERIRDAESEGHDLPIRDVPALGRFVEEVRHARTPR